MKTETPLVSVVVPARDVAPTLRRTLEALRAQTLAEPFEVVVVDDGSTDDTAAIAEQFAGFVHVVRTEGIGPGAARNLGVSAARAELIAFTDADCFPTPGWLEAGTRALRGAALVQGAVHPDPDSVRTPFDRTLDVSRDRGLYQTANLLVRRDVFDAVGGFEDWVLTHEAERTRARRSRPDRRRGRRARTPIGEDTDFAWRARRGGAAVAFAPDAVVHHAVVPGRLGDQLEDIWHWSRDMPGLVARVPELREAALYRRWFFHQRTAHFALGLTGIGAAATLQRPALLVAAVPYARWVARESAPWTGRRRARAAVGTVVADAVTFAGLAAGSVAWRTPVL